MGLIETNYEIKDMGILLDNAYAQIKDVSIDINGVANVIFAIQKDRESISTKQAVDLIFFTCIIDKNLPIFEQIYVKAKEEIFDGWQDDIVE